MIILYIWPGFKFKTCQYIGNDVPSVRFKCVRPSVRNADDNLRTLVENLSQYKTWPLKALNLFWLVLLDNLSINPISTTAQHFKLSYAQFSVYSQVQRSLGATPLLEHVILYSFSKKMGEYPITIMFKFL